jgi:hypothetical protein
MATGATIATIKAGLKAAYQEISFPGGLGLPTVITRELDGLPSSFPYVEIHTNPTQSITQPRDEQSYQVTRRFIARLYTALLPDDTPSIEDADYIVAENCIEPVTDYFYFTDDRLGVAFVTRHLVTADTAAVQLFTRANRNCVGVAFEHQVEYYRMR